jgi:hypothetical protein
MSERPRFSLSLYDEGDQGQYGVGLVLIESGLLGDLDSEDHHQSCRVKDFAERHLVILTLCARSKVNLMWRRLLEMLLGASFLFTCASPEGMEMTRSLRNVLAGPMIQSKH